ncbi:MAG: HD domain-containing phosphohydrolase [Thermotogota bacterium]
MSKHDLKLNIEVLKLAKIFVEIGDSRYSTLIKHSTSVANIFCFLIKHLKLDYEGWRIYFTGLFHDITLLMIAILNDYEKATAFIREEPDIEQIVLEFDGKNKHSFLGAYFLKSIDFPEVYQKLLIYHHTSLKRVGERDRNLVLAVNSIQLADRISIELLKDESQDKAALVKKIVEKNTVSGEITPEVKDILENEDISEAMNMDLHWDFDDVSFDLEQSVQFVKGIAFLLDAKSPYTRNHSTIVSKVSSEIAFRMMSETDAKVIELAALLHDIGKFKVPLKILHKKEALTEDEWEIMKEHVSESYQMLSRSGLTTIAKIAAAHHERIDGTGYPSGLSMEHLTLYARILQVADIYSALIEERPYRTKMTPEKAVEILDELVDEDKLDKRVVNYLKKMVSESNKHLFCDYYDTLEEFLGVRYEKFI